MEIELNHKELGWMIERCYSKRTPLFIWGATGIGKSAVVADTAMRMAKKRNLEFKKDEFGDDIFTLIDMRMSEERDPSNLKGLPFPNKERDKTKWLAPEYFPDFGQGIIFLDELNLALPIIQSACYELIHDRRIRDMKLPDGFYVLAAGNRMEDCANVFDMAKPLCNRFVHVSLKYSFDSWLDWAQKNQIDGRLQGFLYWKPSYLNKFDEDSDDKAFATPRSMELASNLIDGVTDVRKLEMLVGSAVGTGIAAEFIAFNSLENKVSIAEILMNPEKMKEIEEISLKYFILGGIVEKYRKQKSNKKALLSKVLQVCSNLDPEFAILLLRMIKGTIGVGRFAGIVVEVPEWKQIGSKYEKYLVD